MYNGMVPLESSADELGKKTNIGSNEQRIHYGIWVLLVGMFTIFGCIGLGRFAIGMIIPEMGSSLLFSNTQLGLIVSGAFVGYLISITVAGNLAATLGPKKVIAISMFMISGGMLIAGSAHGFFQALLGQVLIGVGTGGSNIPTVGLIARWYTQKLRGLASGLIAIGSGFGFAMAGVFAPYLSFLFGSNGWRASWFFIALVVAAIAVLGIVVFRDDPSDVGAQPVGAKQGSGNLNCKDGSGMGHGKCVRDIYVSRPLWELGLIYFMFGFSYVVFTTFFPKYLIEQVGFPHVLAGRLWFVIGIVSILSGFSWGMLSDKIGRKRALIIVYGIQGVCLAVLGLSLGQEAMIFSSIVYALTLWGIPAIMSAACADYVGGVLASAALGMITVFFGIGQVLNPWISGYIIDLTHSFSIPFIMSAGASALGAIFSVALPKRD